MIIILSCDGDTRGSKAALQRATVTPHRTTHTLLRAAGARGRHQVRLLHAHVLHREPPELASSHNVLGTARLPDLWRTAPLVRRCGPTSPLQPLHLPLDAARATSPRSCAAGHCRSASGILALATNNKDEQWACECRTRRASRHRACRATLSEDVHWRLP